MDNRQPSLIFLERLSAAWPVDIWRDVPVLVAVSGGGDSVALLRGLAALRTVGEGRLVVGHFNHQLRGAAADEDQRFVERLATALGLECCVGRGDVIAQAADEGDGVEAAARDQRYAFLVATAGRVGARYVATAHTADDQAETILQRIVRGTGLAGLAGIPRVRPLNRTCSSIRPLLTFRRNELCRWLAEIGQDYREDETNGDRRYTRNRIRHELLPQLARDYNPGVVDSLLRLATLSDEVMAEIDPRVDTLLRAAVNPRERTPDRVVLYSSALRCAPALIVREAFIRLWQEQGWPLQAMGFDEWQRLAALAVGANRDAALTLPGNIDVRHGPADEVLFTRR